MEIRLSSNKDATSDDFKNNEIIVDCLFQKFGVGVFEFEGCKFTFESTGALKLQNCIIRDCIFQGLDSLLTSPIDQGFLEVISCKTFQKNRFNGEFRRIDIQDSVIADFKDDSIATHYSISTTEVLGFTIKGECEFLVTNTIYFREPKKKYSPWHTKNYSIWDKKVAKTINCTQTIFDNVKLNPFYFVTKCTDKSQIDLSRATLIDNWSRLRKKYAGLSLFIVFFLSFLFFLPIFTHSFLLLTISKAEIQVQIFDKIPLWKVLLFGGKEGISALGYSILTIVLVLYNIGRVYMTISISKLREEETFLKDSNFNLAAIHHEKYKGQLVLDRILSLMFWLSVAYSLLKLWDTLVILVPAFK